MNCPKCKKKMKLVEINHGDYRDADGDWGSHTINDGAISFQENSTHKSAERDDLLMFNNSPKICELNLSVSPPNPKGMGIQNTDIL